MKKGILTSHILLPHKQVMLRLLHFDFELDANEAEVDGSNTNADEAIEADAAETDEANKANEANEANEANKSEADEADKADEAD
jgi:hypothetical protein